MRLPTELSAAAAAGLTILTPNAELAGALFAALEAEQRAAGRELWQTPRVRDFGSWLRERHLSRLLSDERLPRCLNEVEERELWREVIEDSPASVDFLDPGIAARAARRARRTVIEHGIPWRELQRDAADETRIFLDWNQRFEERCRALGATGQDGLLGTGLAASERVVWIDSLEWRPAARRELARLAAPLQPKDRSSRAISWLHAVSPDEELAQVADWAKASLDSFAQFRAWICIPDLAGRRAQVIDAFDAAMVRRRFALEPHAPIASYAIGGGTPLADYAPVRTALALLHMSGAAVPFVQFSGMLRDPALQVDAAEASHVAWLDVELRRRAPPAAPILTWLSLCEAISARQQRPAPAPVGRLRAALKPLLAIRGARRLSEWVPLWTQAFDAAPWVAAARWSSGEYQAAERLRELLTSLAAADEFFGSRTREAAQRIVYRAARETAFQPQTGVPPITISDRLMDPWLLYDGLWVTGLSDSRWPQPVDAVQLLPVGLQRRYGVRAADPASRHQDAREIQRAWSMRAEQCVFSIADPLDGQSLRPSSLLQLGAPLEAHALSRPHWHEQFAQAPTLLKFIDEVAPPFAAGERTRGVATLKAQSRCPFRGFAETRLRADPLSLPVPGFNEMERGELVHIALERVWQELGSSQALQALDEERLTSLLEAGIERALRMVCAERDPGPRWRQRERERLLGLLADWLEVERARMPFRIESLEGEARVASFGGLEFRCRLDRADALADGSRVLIDYKTGAAGADWRGERPDNPQLPIYALLSPVDLVAVAYAKVSAADPKFVFESERDGVFDRRKATKLEEHRDFQQLISTWHERISRLAGDFAAGRAEVAPTATACRNCALHGLCRVLPDYEEGEADE